jgi:hypothetical protein
MSELRRVEEKRRSDLTLNARLGRRDKANFVRASLRLQEVVCTLFFAARSDPTGGARRRFS